MTREQILKEIERLSEDVLIATNAGTFGAAECCRAVGTGDPAFGEYRTYERLDGSTYTTGADPQKAPGYERRGGHDSAAARRAKIDSLKIALETAETAEQRRQNDMALLARGWDGAQFVGIEEGQRRLQAMK